MAMRLRRCAVTGLIAGVAAAAPAMGQAEQPTSLCHATGDPASPYVVVEVDAAELAAHQAHAGDVIPVPVGGCPAAVAQAEPVPIEDDAPGAADDTRDDDGGVPAQPAPAAAVPAAPQPAPAQLPYTGLDAGWVAALGALLVVLGLAGRRLTRPADECPMAPRRSGGEACRDLRLRHAGHSRLRSPACPHHPRRERGPPWAGAPARRARAVVRAPHRPGRHRDELGRRPGAGRQR
jgi:hypothetical protein